ncbi:MlaD family protein [Salinibacter altiplanensis]|uniref:MlaD family protein n=1 Tax=Salinibacter altiplanensis TaxID=1803181 RepID=UPI000C9F25A5|nr:MlaD family protein [Salinibacter altiplanensis]
MSSDRSDEKERERFWNEFRVGVLAVTALGLLVLGVRFLQSTALFGSTYTLTARFEQAEGVAAGTPVTVRGISVGTVDRVALAEDAGVRVRMHIQDDVQLREGTTASVGGIAALDDVSVSLNRADAGDPLATGARLPTVEQGTLDELQERALPIAERIDSVLAQTSGTLSEAQRVLTGSEPNVQRLTENLRSASAGIDAFVQRERAPMRRAIGHLEHTTATLEALVDTLNRDTLARAVEDAERTLHYTRRTARSLEQGARDLEAILADLRAGRGTAGRLLDDPGLYHRADSLSLRMDRILEDFEENPGRYISLEIF